MKRSSAATAIRTTAFGIAGAAAAVLARRRHKTAGPGTFTYHSADELAFKEVMPGVKRAVLWGDPDRGAYAGFTRFSPGSSHPLHTHPNDIKLIVLSGVYEYKLGETLHRAGPRSYVFIPAGAEHTSGGDAVEGCLFYEESPGRFGLDEVKK